MVILLLVYAYSFGIIYHKTTTKDSGSPKRLSCACGWNTINILIQEETSIVSISKKKKCFDYTFNDYSFFQKISIFQFQLSVATEERDKLKSLVNELKSLKNDDAEAKATSETLSQVSTLSLFHKLISC